MKNYKEIIEENHCGYNDSIDYDQIVINNKISENDLKYFDEIIKKSKNGGSTNYSAFSDNGGIDIAAILLAEIRRIRKL